VATLGELAALPDHAVADRFGALGLRARRLAAGEDEPLRPRRVAEELVEELELPEAASGEQLGRALELLTDRLLAQRARRGRTLRRLRLEAQLAAGGSWRAEATLRLASADAVRLRLVLEPKLGELPAPVSTLALRALELGPPAGEQPALARSDAERRRERLGEAVRQVRAAAGRDALLRVLDVDPDSRVPERRVLLAPFPES
jgi:protein ImuB